MQKTPWFLVGNGGMHPYDSPPYSSPNNPFPHSLLRASRKRRKRAALQGLGFRAQKDSGAADLNFGLQLKITAPSRKRHVNSHPSPHKSHVRPSVLVLNACCATFLRPLLAAGFCSQHNSYALVHIRSCNRKISDDGVFPKPKLCETQRERERERASLKL